MDKLLTLNPILTPEANEQAEEIFKLMQEAAAKNQTSIIYTLKPDKKLHPLIQQILTSKGYVVELVQNKNLVYTPFQLYSISIGV